MIAKMFRGLVLLGMVSFVGVSLAQVELSQPSEDPAPLFYKDLVAFQSSQPGKSQLEAYFKIPYDELQFLKDATGFYRAIYELSMVVLDEDDFQLDGKIWRDTVTVDNFEATNSQRDFAFTQATFQVPPGKYRINVGLLDSDTGRNSTQKTALIVHDLSTPKLAISDVLIAESVVKDETGRIMPRPLVEAPRQRGEQLFAYVEFYSKTNEPAIDVSYEIKNSRERRVLQQKIRLNTQGSITYLSIPLSAEQLPHDNYSIQVEAKSGKHQAQIEHHFALRWEGIPASVADLEMAIKQMRYIAKQDNVKKILGSSADQRRQAFIDFWRRLDPSPGTERNEALDEYYRRINYANQNFGGFQDGWKTDRGMVFVLFGTPNDIDRNPVVRSQRLSRDTGRVIKAYEIWTYNHLNRQFVFLDENGYGDYRLEYPVALEQYLR